MSNKNDKLTRLGDLIDDDLIEEALEHKKTHLSPGRKEPRFSRRALISAVCIVLCVILLIVAIPMMIPEVINENREQNSDGIDSHPEASNGIGSHPGDSNDIRDTVFNMITSVDELNYYSAVKHLIDSGFSPLQVNSSLSRKSSYSVSLLSSRSYGTEVDTSPITERPPTEGENTKFNPPAPNAGEKIYYYDLSEFGEFIIYSATYFRIEIDEHCYPLGEILGGYGTVEVAITENSIEDPMITFKLGEMYYTCIDIGSYFSTHKQIIGNYLVKDLEKQNYAFYVDRDSIGNVIGMSWSKIEPFEGDTHEIKVVEGSSCYSDSTGTLDIDTLNNYFGSSASVTPDTGKGAVTSQQTEDPYNLNTATMLFIGVEGNNKYLFTVYTDMSYILWDASNGTVLRRGTAAFMPDGILLVPPELSAVAPGVAHTAPYNGRDYIDGFILDGIVYRLDFERDL